MFNFLYMKVNNIFLISVVSLQLGIVSDRHFRCHLEILKMLNSGNNILNSLMTRSLDTMVVIQSRTGHSRFSKYTTILRQVLLVVVTNDYD